MGRTARASALAAVVALAGSLLVATLPSAEADQTYYVPISKSWTVDGRGYGHGHGMSQYGAQGAALQGLKYDEIVNFYYPGTKWDAVKGNVRVLITADWTSDVAVKPARGLNVTDLSDGSKWTLPTDKSNTAWRLTPARNGSTAVEYQDASGWHRWAIPGKKRTFASDGEFNAKGALTLLVPSGDSVVGRKYRGALRSVRPYAGATSRDTVNVLKMDAYVQGVVAYEMPASWKQQALRAQAVAARTYATWMRAQNPHRYYQICDTTSCQVYGGVTAEQSTSNDAVQATKGKILTYKGKPAFTQFASSDGGWTSDGGVPYLPAQKDPYDGFEGNPMHAWSTTVSASSLESSHPEIGNLIDLRVTKRDHHGAWNGRVQQIVLDGTKGKAYLTGDDFRWAYGLRSDWFTIEPTAIIKRWRELGGPDSPLGRPTSGEHAVDGGSAQTFKHGQIFWSSKTGAADVKGPILKAYKAKGGPKSAIGFPATGMMDAPDNGHKVRFQHGKMYSTMRTGAHWVYGAVLIRWGKEGGAAGWIGYPTADATLKRNEVVGVFEHATLTWDRTTKTMTVTPT